MKISDEITTALEWLWAVTKEIDAQVAKVRAMGCPRSVETRAAIDPARCMAALDPKEFGGPRCQTPATHNSIVGRLCDRCAELFRQQLRDPMIAINQVSGRRARTEDEIATLVRRLPEDRSVGR
jgi:hypothetical protein